MGMRKRQREIREMRAHRENGSAGIVPVRGGQGWTRAHEEMARRERSANAARFTSDTIAPTETADEYAERVR